MEKEYDIESLVNDIDFEKNSISYIKGEIVLTNKEVEILKSLDINYESYTSMSSLINALEEYVDDEPELEEILKDMSDRNYYLNTNKGYNLKSKTEQKRLFLIKKSDFLV